jgi:hypothetical protein
MEPLVLTSGSGGLVSPWVSTPAFFESAQNDELPTMLKEFCRGGPAFIWIVDFGEHGPDSLFRRGGLASLY